VANFKSELERLRRLAGGKDKDCIAHLVRSADGLEAIIRGATADNAEETHRLLAEHQAAMDSAKPANYDKWSASRPISVPSAAELERFIRWDNPEPVDTVSDAEFTELEQAPTEQQPVRVSGPVLTAPTDMYPLARRGPQPPKPERDRLQGFREDQTYTDSAQDYE